MATIHRPRHIRALAIRQRHIDRRQLRRLLQPAQRLLQLHRLRDLRLRDARKRQQRRVRPARRHAVDPDPLLGQLRGRAADKFAQRALGRTVRDRPDARDQVRRRDGEDDGGARRQQGRRGLREVQRRVEVDLEGVAPQVGRGVREVREWIAGAGGPRCQ